MMKTHRTAVPTRIDVDLLDTLRDVAVHYRQTLAEVVEDALRREFGHRLERDGLDGFPRRQAELKAGRPIGS